MVEVRTVLETHEMRLLLRGLLQLSVYAKRTPQLRLSGAIGPRIACDLFDCLIVASPPPTASGDVGIMTSSSSSSSSAALAWMYIGRDGGVHYRVKLGNGRLSSPVSRVTIESSSSSSSSSGGKSGSNGSGKSSSSSIGPIGHRIIEDITAQLSTDGQWVNGTVNRLSAKDLELLYEGELWVNVATIERPVTELRGRIVQRLAGDSHLAIVQSGPVLLNVVSSSHAALNANSANIANRAAIAWVHVDNECNFHYDISLTNANGAITTNGGGGGGWSSSSSSINSRSHSQHNQREPPTSFTVLELVDIPRLSVDVHQQQQQQQPSEQSGAGGGIMLMDASGGINDNGNTYGEVPYLPNIRLLDEFSGYQIDNSVADLNKLSLARMDAGVAYLKLTESSIIGSNSASSSTPAVQFQGWLTNVHVPSSCLPYAGAGGSGSRPPQHIGGGVVSSAAAAASSSPDDFLLDGGGGIDSSASSSGDNNEIPPIIASRCFYEGRLFDDASAWTAEHDRCMMCSCQRGRVVCHQVICPSLTLTCTAPTATIVQQPADCCPSCQLSKLSPFQLLLI